MSTVKNYIRKTFSTIGTEASASETSKIMSNDKVGYIIVLENGRPVRARKTGITAKIAEIVLPTIKAESRKIVDPGDWRDKLRIRRYSHTE